MKSKILNYLFWTLLSMIFIGLFGLMGLFVLVDLKVLKPSLFLGNLSMVFMLIHVIGYYCIIIDQKNV